MPVRSVSGHAGGPAAWPGAPVPLPGVVLCWGRREGGRVAFVQAAEVPQTWSWAGTVRVVMSVGACPNGWLLLIFRGRCRFRSVVTLAVAIWRRAAWWAAV